MLNVIEKENGYADFAAVTPPVAGLQKLFSTGQEAPKWLQALAARGRMTDDDRAAVAATEASGNTDDLPF